MSYRNKLYDTCRSKYKDGDGVWHHLNSVFDCLPIAATIRAHNSASKLPPVTFFAVSGGLSPSLKRVEDIDDISRHT